MKNKYEQAISKIERLEKDLEKGYLYVEDKKL